MKIKCKSQYYKIQILQQEEKFVMKITISQKIRLVNHLVSAKDENDSFLITNY